MNKDLSAHFVTNYDRPSYLAILDLAAKDQLSTLDKICLLQDVPLLTRAGIMSSTELLPLAKAFANESNEKVYGMAMMALNELRKFADGDEQLKSALKTVSRDIAQPTYSLLGWDEMAGESDDDRERRSTALSLMIYGESDTALAEAKRRYDLGLSSISVEIRPLVLSAAVRHFESPQMIGNLLDQYTATASSDLQVDIAIGLTSTRSIATISQLLNNLKKPKVIRPQDASRWFIYLIRNNDARATSWQWLKENWSWVESTYGGDKSYDEFVRYAASALLTRAELDDFRNFFTP
ncbi:hypothetical protein B7Z17_02975, partial [Candidatus Saccharibacteria bacterium 32-49-10]